MGNAENGLNDIVEPYGDWRCFWHLLFLV